MDFELAEEHRMLKDLVARFVRDELMPLEAGVLEREASGKGLGLEDAEHKRLDKISRELGLWGLDAPEDIGGSDLPNLAMVGVEEELLPVDPATGRPRAVAGTALQAVRQADPGPRTPDRDMVPALKLGGPMRQRCWKSNCSCSNWRPIPSRAVRSMTSAVKCGGAGHPRLTLRPGPVSS